LPDLSIESSLNGIIAGVDEAGRGPWAGPVVAAAVILDRNNIPFGINDSKKLTRKQREIIFAELYQTAHIGVGIASVEEIDSLNILHASMLAMSKAVAALPLLPDYALIDGNRIPRLPCKGQYVVGGDAISLSIGAASIIAKVTRDKIMAELALQHPEYLWERNSGYGTEDHQNGLRNHGVTVHHRRSFRPIAEILERVLIEG
jgi:ribonuclease HII